MEEKEIKSEVEEVKIDETTETLEVAANTCTNNEQVKVEDECQTYIDPKTGKTIQTIVVRKEHKYGKLFWKGFYSFMGFWERHIPHNILQYLKYTLLSACAGLVEILTNMILNYSLEGVRENVGMCKWIVGDIYITTLIATLVGLVLGIIVNFTINRKFTFRSDGSVGRALMFVVAFYIVITPLKTMWNGYMPGYLTGVMDMASANTLINLLGMFIIGILEFTYQKVIVYRKEENSALKKKKK